MGKKEPSFLSAQVLSAAEFEHGFFWENGITHFATIRNNSITLLMVETTLPLHFNGNTF